MKLIDKNYLIQYLTGMANAECCDDNTERIIKKYIIPHINTLEVKEVDLEKEMDKEWNKCEPIDEGMGLEIASIEHEQFDNIVKHFFELGLKARK